MTNAELAENQYKLGCYYYGIYGPNKLNTAIMWWEQAAKGGNKNAIKILKTIKKAVK